MSENKEKQEIHRKNGCFTMNNYSEEDWRTLCDNSDRFQRLIIAKEIAPETGTPHIQGYCEFFAKTRRVAFFKALGVKHAHWNKEPVKGDIWAQLRYCEKEGREIFKKNIPMPLQRYVREDLNEAQCKVVDLFKDREDAKWGRKIYWFWENVGLWGKSLCCSYMIDNMGATQIGGRRTDMFCGLIKLIDANDECPPIVLVDLPRDKGNRLDYSGLENIKDGKFFSPKYESGMVRFNRPHIAVFANVPPKEGAYSEDRLVVVHLSDKSDAKSTTHESKTKKMVIRPNYLPSYLKKE